MSDGKKYVWLSSFWNWCMYVFPLKWNWIFYSWHLIGLFHCRTWTLTFQYRNDLFGFFYFVRCNFCFISIESAWNAIKLSISIGFYSFSQFFSFLFRIICREERDMTKTYIKIRYLLNIATKLMIPSYLLHEYALWSYFVRCFQHCYQYLLFSHCPIFISKHIDFICCS